MGYIGPGANLDDHREGQFEVSGGGNDFMIERNPPRWEISVFLSCAQ